MAIDFVQALDTPERRAMLKERGLYDGWSITENSHIVLVLAGYTYDDLTGLYQNRLKQKVRQVLPSKRLQALLILPYLTGL